MREITALLSHQGAAVLHRDEQAFTAPLAGGRTSAAFRDRQQATFANLVDVPLASWSYSVAARVDDRSAERVASKRYRTAAVIVRISLRYALRGADRRPSAHDLWWTFVRSGGKVVVAGDTDLRADGGRSWRGPWDFGPVVVVRAALTLVLGHPGNRATLRSIADTVASAIPVVTGVWGRDWARAVAVVVPASSDELAAAAGQTSTVTADVAAVAVADPRDEVTGTVSGQRLIVNPAALARLSVVGRGIVVRHEVTHIAAATVTSERSPRWLVEGFADYVGNLGSGQPVTQAATELRADVGHGRVPTALPSEADFDNPRTAAQAYQGAWLACRLIAARAGRPGLLRFYRLVAAAPSGADDTIAQALHVVLGETRARFTALWRAYLSGLLR